MSLESKNYVATPADIAALARAYSEALTASGNVRGHYLRALVATTQDALGVKPRLRTTATDKPTLDANGIKAQLDALEEVHGRFYQVVLDTMDGKNAEERNRKSGFARSAMSTVRAYVRAGFDITLLAAARITKAALAAVVPTKRARAVSLGVLRRQADRALTTLYKIGDALSKADKAQAVEVLESAMAKLGSKLASLGGTAVTDAKRAQRERVPLKTGAGTFYPVGRAAH